MLKQASACCAVHVEAATAWCNTLQLRSHLLNHCDNEIAATMLLLLLLLRGLLLLMSDMLDTRVT
jgi:hypothetical protein